MRVMIKILLASGVIYMQIWAMLLMLDYAEPRGGGTWAAGYAVASVMCATLAAVGWIVTSTKGGR